MRWCEKCGQPLPIENELTYYESLYETLKSIVWYNGHTEWLKELIKGLEERKKKELFRTYPNPFPIDQWHTEQHTIWMLLVGMFGDWGTSIRSGWIEDFDDCIEFIQSIIKESEDEQ